MIQTDFMKTIAYAKKDLKSGNPIDPNAFLSKIREVSESKV